VKKRGSKEPNSRRLAPAHPKSSLCTLQRAQCWYLGDARSCGNGTEDPITTLLCGALRFQPLSSARLAHRRPSCHHLPNFLAPPSIIHSPSACFGSRVLFFLALTTFFLHLVAFVAETFTLSWPSVILLRIDFAPRSFSPHNCKHKYSQIRDHLRNIFQKPLFKKHILHIPRTRVFSVCSASSPLAR